MDKWTGEPIQSSIDKMNEEYVSIYQSDNIFTIRISTPFREIGPEMINDALEPAGLPPIRSLPAPGQSFRKIRFSDEVMELVTRHGESITRSDHGKKNTAPPNANLWSSRASVARG